MNKGKILLLNPNRHPDVIGLTKKEASYFLMTASPIETFSARDICTSLGYITSLLREKGHEVKVVDAQTMDYSNEKLLEIIEDFSPSTIGLTSAPLGAWRCYPLTTKHISNACALLKKVKSKPKVILMGPHGTAFPFLFKGMVDVVIKGEPEEIFLKIIENPGNINNIKGIAFWQDKKFIETEGINYVTDFDSLPIPAYDQILFGKTKEISVFSSRGCPYSCVFCYKLMPKQEYRMRSAKKVVEEIKLLAEKYGVTRIYFLDEIFTINKDHVLDICRELKENKIEITWATQTRPEFADYELMKTMKEAGCVKIDIGLESGDKEILEKSSKKYELKDVVKFSEIMKKVRMRFRAFMVVGLPGETTNTIKNSLNFLGKIKPDEIGCLLATPFPGTPLFEIGVREGKVDINWIKNHEWEKVGCVSGLIDTDFGKSNKRIKIIAKNFRLYYYLHRSNLLFLYPILKRIPIIWAYNLLRKAKYKRMNRERKT